MKTAKRKEVELRFASYVVADMLQRSGTKFRFSPNESHVGAVDFVVINGTNTPRSLKVKYSDGANQAKSLWENWIGARKPPSDYLVVVTGNGDQVYADPSVQNLLATDRRTKLSIFKKEASAAR